MQSTSSDPKSGSLLDQVWLELTGQCNLRCTHCYADSNPTGNHGVLTLRDWDAVIADAKQLGVITLQFTGGEPTLHPDFPALVRLAANVDIGVEVFTNLLHMSPQLWALFEECDVALATSFYALQPDLHDRVTTQAGSQQKTLANIRVALSRSLPIRVGLIQVFPEQDGFKAEEMLRSLGVTQIRIDHVRGVGRGVNYEQPERPVDALCGHCSLSAAIDPNGFVYPCVFSRWLSVGRVPFQTFSSIVSGRLMQQARTQLDQEFSSRVTCFPRITCFPQLCAPPCLPSIRKH